MKLSWDTQLLKAKHIVVTFILNKSFGDKRNSIKNIKLQSETTASMFR